MVLGEFEARAAAERPGQASDIYGDSCPSQEHKQANESLRLLPHPPTLAPFLPRIK